MWKVTSTSVVLIAIVLPDHLAAESPIEPASYTGSEKPVPAGETSVVTFSHQAARVGDRLAQDLSVELDIDTTIEQSGQVASSGRTAVKRRQRRFIEVMEIVDGRARKAHVKFPISREASASGDQAEEEKPQPVEGKSYFVTRQGKRLAVTDTSGAIPPREEFKIVFMSMQSLGQPNPLAGFLRGKEITLGTRLQLPHEIAQQLLGFDDQFGEVDQFVMELTDVKSINGQTCAVFAATIHVKGDKENPMNIVAEGKVMIETETSRTIFAELTGPVTMKTIERTEHGEIEYRATGSMSVAIRSQYGYAPE